MEDFSTLVLTSLFFIVGYIFIILEHPVRVNKAGTALMTAIVMWGFLLFMTPHTEDNAVSSELSKHLSSVSEVIFFLLGAMSIVEIINAHKGFNFFLHILHIRSLRLFCVIFSLVAFFLSAILDNLTTTLVMVAILRRVVHDKQQRLLVGGAIVIAANAGGAWTPIGDITTTMLWIGGEITTVNTITTLFIPSLVCLLGALIPIYFMLDDVDIDVYDVDSTHEYEPRGKFIFILGIASLVSVPLIKVITGLPPYMGMLFGLSILWIFTDRFHAHFENRDHLRLPNLFTKVDLAGPLFFFGILLAVGSLETVGLLTMLEKGLDHLFTSKATISLAIGLLSSLVDNVPLVAACMNMYSLEQVLPDAPFWQGLAYCAGTGGSILVIGSAAGVAFMALEKVSFLWYLRYVSLPALLGYLAGFGAYLLIV